MIPRRARRAINQMNVVPYIDVMLVLLVIFMVTAPFLSPTQVELPKLGKSSQAPVAPLEVMVQADSTLKLRDRAAAGTEESVVIEGLLESVQGHLKMRAEQPVVISADRNVRYERVMQVMDTLQRGGVGRVGLLVQPATP